MKKKVKGAPPQTRQVDRRIELQRLLEGILGSKNVYFEPPEGTKMAYPCIRYRRVRYDARHADNRPYILIPRYELTFIYRDPDNETTYKLAQLPSCTHDRSYTSDNLSHDTYTLYF